jgi:predicted transcriptional regulator
MKKYRKLTPEIIAKIKLYESQGISQRKIADMVGLSQGAVSNVINPQKMKPDPGSGYFKVDKICWITGYSIYH